MSQHSYAQKQIKYEIILGKTILQPTFEKTSPLAYNYLRKQHNNVTYYNQEVNVFFIFPYLWQIIVRKTTHKTSHKPYTAEE